MKGWFKLLVLATIPILAVTAVVNQGLAADKGLAVDLPEQHRTSQLHLCCKRRAGRECGYGAGSVLQQRYGDVELTRFRGHIQSRGVRRDPRWQESRDGIRRSSGGRS